MMKPRTILASDLMEGDRLRHTGVIVEVTSLRITSRSTFVLATPVDATPDEDDEGREEVEIRFRRDAKVRILPKPPKAPAGKAPESKIPKGTFYVYDVLADMSQPDALGEQTNGIVHDIGTKTVRLQLERHNYLEIRKMDDETIEIRTESGTLVIRPHSANVAKVQNDPHY
jgi:hypothetical protein